jgi:CheY-like chemotaxis protein
LCEPNAVARTALVQLLEDGGWQALLCTNPNDALSASRSGQPIAALLVDIREGMAIAEAVRQRQPEVLVLYMSTGSELPEGSVGELVQKPIDFSVIERLLTTEGALAQS